LGFALKRQGHNKRGTFALLALDLKGTVVVGNDNITDIEPQPGALTLGFGREEWIEYSR
jgi:hypothetical protein